MVITVRHAAGAYDVRIGPGLLGALPALLEELLPRRRPAIVTDGTVDPIYQHFLHDATALWRDATPPLAHDLPRLAMAAGEAHKTRETWADLTDRLLALELGRDSALVALGGGVVGDVAGFVAATYLRGIPFVQAPTTLLAMLDASVGGKTGVDTPAGKNLVGAFHPPALVLADPRTLLTLPERTFRAGLAEAVKHGLIADPAYFEWMRANAARLLDRDLDGLTELIGRSVAIKAAIVSADERESGRRAMLNAGHTLAHAIEHASRFAVPHGEAVAMGLVGEARIAERLGVAEAGTGDRLAALLDRLGLPVAAPALAADQLAAGMLHDKKNRRGEVHCALPAAVGRMHASNGRWTTAVPVPLLLDALATG